MTPPAIGPMPDDAMRLDDILAPDDVIHGLRVSGKAALLEDLARRAAQALDLDAGAIRAALVRREELGSTGISGGLALPHARLEAVRRPWGLLARLRDPLDFEAIDERPVDLVVLLLLPAGGGGESLNALACVTRRLREPETAAALRGARDAASLRALMGERPLGRG